MFYRLDNFPGIQLFIFNHDFLCSAIQGGEQFCHFYLLVHLPMKSKPVPLFVNEFPQNRHSSLRNIRSLLFSALF